MEKRNERVHLALIVFDKINAKFVKFIKLDTYIIIPTNFIDQLYKISRITIYVISDLEASNQYPHLTLTLTFGRTYMKPFKNNKRQETDKYITVNVNY